MKTIISFCEDAKVVFGQNSRSIYLELADAPDTLQRDAKGPNSRMTIAKPRLNLCLLGDIYINSKLSHVLIKNFTGFSCLFF